MSVNSVMTSLANKVRMLGSGSETGDKIGIDEMVTNLERVVTNISDAYEAVEYQGGTIPNTKTSGNLFAAINSIPKGATVKKISGQFTTNSQGQATVTLGFKPDIVYIKSTTRTVNGWTMDASSAIAFDLENRANTPCTSYRYTYNQYDFLVDAMWQQNESGFGVTICSTYNNSTSVSANITVDYIAVKYTE
jgi:hypothetical protein